METEAQVKQAFAVRVQQLGLGVRSIENYNRIAVLFGPRTEGGPLYNHSTIQKWLYGKTSSPPMCMIARRILAAAPPQGGTAAAPTQGGTAAAPFQVGTAAAPPQGETAAVPHRGDSALFAHAIEPSVPSEGGGSGATEESPRFLGQPRVGKSGHVYVLRELNIDGVSYTGLVKVGMVNTDDKGYPAIVKRFTPREIIPYKTFHVASDAAHAERIAHQKLAEYHVVREWFNVGDSEDKLRLLCALVELAVLETDHQGA